MFPYERFSPTQLREHNVLYDNLYRQADKGHTTVEFLLKFNGGKGSSTEKLRKIVKSGDIAGISVDASFFKIDWYVLAPTRRVSRIRVVFI